MSWVQSCWLLLVLLPCVTCDQCEVQDTCVYTSGNDGANEHTHQKTVEESKDACGQRCCQNDLCTMAVFFRSTEPGSPNCRLHLCNPTSACHSVVKPDGDADVMCVTRHVDIDKRDNPENTEPPQQTTQAGDTQPPQTTTKSMAGETQTTSGANNTAQTTVSQSDNTSKANNAASVSSVTTAAAADTPTLQPDETESNNTVAQTTVSSEQEDISSQTLASGAQLTTKTQSNQLEKNTEAASTAQPYTTAPLVLDDGDVNATDIDNLDSAIDFKPIQDVANTTVAADTNTTALLNTTDPSNAATEASNATALANESSTAGLIPEQQVNSTVENATIPPASNSTGSLSVTTSAPNTTDKSSVTNGSRGDAGTEVPPNIDTTTSSENNDSNITAANQTQPPSILNPTPPTNSTTPAPATEYNSVTEGQTSNVTGIGSTEKQESTTSTDVTQAPNATSTPSNNLSTPIQSLEKEADAIEAAEILAALLLEDVEITENVTNSNGSLSASGEALANLGSDSTMIVVLVSALSIGVTVFLVVVMLVGRRVLEGWKRRHYSRIDYLTR